MARVTTFAFALLAALGIIGTGAVAVSASGHEFVASKTGKTSSKGTSPQIFKTSAGTIECSTVSGSGEITALKSEAHKEALTYSGCEGFGFSSITVTVAHFAFNANGSAKLESSVTITPEGSGCEIIVPAQTVETVGYSNEAGKVKANSTIAKIHSKGSGGVCGGESTEGSFTGKMVATLEGGTIEWK